MMKKPTKAARIRELNRLGLDTQEIADKCKCLPQYVSIVLKQRVPGGSNPHIKYRLERYHLGDRKAASEACCKTKYACLKAGMSHKEAVSRGGGAYFKVMMKTGSLALNKGARGYVPAQSLRRRAKKASHGQAKA